MKRLLSFLKSLFNFAFLTVLTQIGGVIYLIYKPIYKSIFPKKRKALSRITTKLLTFSFFYGIATFLIVPNVAPSFGRVALPIVSGEDVSLKPHNYFYVIANRHYVKPELKSAIVSVAKKMNKNSSGTELLYLDANFPFWEGFRLFPHLSHDDGEKLDIAYLYTDEEGNRVNQSPSWFGYGVSELPKGEETNQPQFCENKGKWQYNMLYNVTPQSKKKSLPFDEKENRRLLNFICAESAVNKVFIEPHLKERLVPRQAKVRFHGCQAVRHDDHIHIQL